MTTQTQTQARTKTKAAAAAAPYRLVTAAQFARLKPASKRVKIAQDVLHVLGSGVKSRYQVERGTYCKMYSAETPIKGSQQLQKILPKVIRNCHVCAMGALFLSHVRINNKFKVSDIGDYTSDYFGVSGNDIQNHIDSCFPDIRVIEKAFESACYQTWGAKYSDPVKRLRAIMHNIIRNKGDFDINEVH